MSQSRLRWMGIAGIVGALSFTVGDILLLGADRQRDRHPVLSDTAMKHRAPELLDASPRGLSSGALAGILPPPLFLAGFANIHEGLRPAGFWGATVPFALLAAAWTYPSYIHGTFLAYGSAYQLLDEHVAADSPLTPAARVHYRRIEKVLGVSYLPFLGATAAASGLIAWHVAAGRTRYPRWAAPLLAPAPAILASGYLEHAVTRDRDVRAPLRGAGLSIGHLIPFIASTALQWKDRTHG
ncbi:DUF6796 family protein [Tsukamurella tyrosinosolvens]|uniref:DUF6796 family protein n=1 Tax=Tsukamurella tyrosinosolvens TaxID=57704 RepID=UPI000C7ED5E2|nr:DUF6796 family protein [Tsukamurella tyrosinosolvens]AUN41796.1 hypothetical protein ASU32_18745 [Tsukamurella tyrosinosolvens]